MTNIGDILNSPEQGWRRVLFSDFDSINFYIYTNYTENYKDFIIQGGLHLYYDDVTTTYFSFSNAPYTTKWRLIGSTIKEGVDLFNLPPDSAYQVNYITPDSEHRLLMEGIFEPEGTFDPKDPNYYGSDFHAEINYSNTDFVLYAIDFYYESITPPKVVKGTPNEGINGTLSNGLLAHYSFNEGSLADLSGNGRDLIQFGTKVLSNDKDGQSNQALNIYNDSYYTTNDVNKPIYSLPEWSISIWFNIKDYISYEGLLTIGHYDGGGGALKLYRDESGTLAFNSETFTFTDINTWHSFVITKNSSNRLKLFIDKVLIQEDTIVYPDSSFNDLVFGKRLGFLERQANAEMDEIRLYSRVITGGDTIEIGQTASGEIAEIFDMGVNYGTSIKSKISETIFNIDFDKVHLGDLIKIKYLDIKSNGVSILNKNPIVKYWNNYDNTPKIFSKEGELFGNSMDLYFQIECDGYETSDVIHKKLRMIHIDGYHDYSGGGGSYEAHNNDNYKKSEARILIPLTNTSFISYKK